MEETSTPGPDFSGEALEARITNLEKTLFMLIRQFERHSHTAAGAAVVPVS